MTNSTVPNPVVQRISLYLRRLEALAAQGTETVSSHQLAESLRLSSAQVRKDLTYFGQFGRPGVGYRVGPLVEELRRILGTDKVSSVVVIGVGDLGRALLRHRGFRKKGFDIVAAFDISAAKIGKRIGSVEVRHIDELPKVVRKHRVRLAVLTVPTDAAQSVAKLLCRSGIHGILNFAPTILNTPADLAVFPVDLAASLEQLSFQVSSRR